jgi:monoamine oxidase
MNADVRSYTGLIPNIGLGQLADTQLILLTLKLLQFLLWCLRPTSWLSRWADRTTMAAFARRWMWTAGGGALLRIIVQAFLGAEPGAVSVLALCRYITANDSVEAMSEIGEGSLQAWTTIGGAQQLSARLADGAMAAGATILLNHKVVDVSHASPRGAAAGTITLRCEAGQSFDTHHVLVCAPAPVVHAYIRFSPALSAGRQALCSSTAMGGIIKSIIVFPRAFWRQAGFSGEVVCDTSSDPTGGPCFNLFDGCALVGSTPAALGCGGSGSAGAAAATAEDLQRLSIGARSAEPSAHYIAPALQEWIAAGRPSAGTPAIEYVEAPHPGTGAPARFIPALVAFINGAKAREWSPVAFEARRTAVLQQIARWFACDEALAPLEYIEQDWTAYPHTRGCPVAAYGRGVLEEFGLARRLSQPEWPVPAPGCSGAGPAGPGATRAAGAAIHRLHFAGTETAEQGTGFMDGAIRSGWRAAEEIAADLAAEGHRPGRSSSGGQASPAAGAPTLAARAASPELHSPLLESSA